MYRKEPSGTSRRLAAFPRLSLQTISTYGAALGECAKHAHLARITVSPYRITLTSSKTSDHRTRRRQLHVADSPAPQGITLCSTVLPTPKRLLHVQSCSLLPAPLAAPLSIHQGLRAPWPTSLSITPRASPACSLPYPSTTTPTPLLAKCTSFPQGHLFTPLPQLTLPHRLRRSQTHSPCFPPPTLQHASQTIYKSSRAEAEHTRSISAQSPMPVPQGNKEFTNRYNKYYN